LLPLLDERGIHVEVAVLAAAMIGPMQVTGRLAMLVIEEHITPIAVTLLSVLSLTVAAMALYAVKFSPMLIVVFVVFQGAGFGMTSILRPVLIAELLGRRKFGAIAGVLAVPFLVFFALAPSIAGLLWGVGGYSAVIAATGAASLIGLAGLIMAAWSARKLSFVR